MLIPPSKIPTKMRKTFNMPPHPLWEIKVFIASSGSLTTEGSSLKSEGILLFPVVAISNWDQ